MVTGLITVTQASLAGVEVDHAYDTVINSSFNLTIMPVDSVTLRRLGQPTWGGWTWLAIVSIYTLPQYNCNGTLIISPSPSLVIDSSAGTVTITNMKINGTGMYMLNVTLISTNLQYIIHVRSYGILIRPTNSK